MNKQQALMQVRKIMKDNLFKRHVLSKGGTLCTNRLYAHKTSKYIFTRPSEKEGKAYHVELLVDNSGSMYPRDSIFGNSPDRAKPAFEACQKVAGVLGSYSDMQITAFNYVEKKYGHKEFCKLPFEDYECWDKNYYVDILKEGDTSHFSNIKKGPYNICAGNWEICNIMNAYHRLRQKEGQKIIIIFLDGAIHMDDFSESSAISQNLHIAGQPIRKYNTKTYVDDIKRMEADGIKVKAFGIQTDEPEQYFSDFTQIDDPEDIYKHLVEFLTKVI